MRSFTIILSCALFAAVSAGVAHSYANVYAHSDDGHHYDSHDDGQYHPIHHFEGHEDHLPVVHSYDHHSHEHSDDGSYKHYDDSHLYDDGSYKQHHDDDHHYEHKTVLVSAPVAHHSYAHAPVAHHSYSHAPVAHHAPAAYHAAPAYHSYAAPAVVSHAPVVHHASPVVHHAPAVHHAAPVVHAHTAIAHSPVVHHSAPVVHSGLYAHAPAQNVYASHYDHQDYYAHPKYKFSYGVSDPHTGDHKSQWEVRDGDVVKGEYSLIEPDGTKRVVSYHADDHTGFHADVKKIGHAVHAPVYHATPIVASPHSYGHGYSGQYIPQYHY